MNETKPWYTSVTMWGIFLAAGAQLLSAKPELASALASDATAEAFAQIGTLIGLAVSAWGRVRAKSVIGK